MQEALTTVIGYLVPLVEACGALIIVLEVARTIIQYLGAYLRKRSTNVTALRLRLGRGMVMGLEFQVAADILKTALSPTWNDMLLLAALIGLRTVLNYLLESEMRMLHKDAASSMKGGPARQLPEAKGGVLQR